MTVAAPRRPSPKAALERVGPDSVAAEQARRELSRFVREAWGAVEPGVAYQHGWHIDAVCEHLEAVTRGEILRLIINIPPRHMKSMAAAVFWPAWAWIDKPELRWVFTSYAARLSTKHSVLCRRLIQSRWYQQRWGNRFELSGDQNMKTMFENDHGGFRFATSVGGTITGEGGDVVVHDDPHKVDEAESEDARENVCEWRDGTVSSRKNDPAKGAEVLVMQRLHEGDLTGHLLEKGGWTHLCLPAEYEPAHPFIWPEDPRTRDGEVLWQPRWNAELLADQRADLGTYRYTGQYQQLPSPSEGGILKREWWRRYSSVPQIEEVSQSWDCAFKDLDDSDYVVGQAWGRDGADRFLLAQVRARLSFTETCGAMVSLDAWVDELYPGKRHAVWVEDKANGTAVIDLLRRVVQGLVPIEPEGGKEARAHAASPALEAGQVHIPAGEYIPAPVVFALTPSQWADLLAGEVPDLDEVGDVIPVEQTSTADFIDEAAAFPNGLHDDQVDGFTQAIIKMKHRTKRRPRAGTKEGDSRGKR